MCPRLGGSAFFEIGQRDLGVSSKAHKFACELRALLASDKHLGSAERSERQLPTNKHASECPRHCGGSDGCATAAGPRDLRLKHDGRSLPAPFLPVKVGSVDFPIEKGGILFFLFLYFPSSIC